MGILTTIIILLFLFVGIAFAWGYIQDTVFELVKEGNELFARIETSKIIEVTPQAQETVCDLSIEIFAEYHNPQFTFSFQEDDFIAIGGEASDNRVKKYIWSECHSTTLSLLNMLNLNRGLEQTNLQLASLFDTVADLEVETYIRLTDTQTGDVIDKFNTQGLSKTTNIGGREPPIAFQPKFFLDDIPHRNYKMDIFFIIKQGDTERATRINDMADGKPFRDEICKSTVTSFPCT